MPGKLHGGCLLAGALPSLLNACMTTASQEIEIRSEAVSARAWISLPRPWLQVSSRDTRITAQQAKHWPDTIVQLVCPKLLRFFYYYAFIFTQYSRASVGTLTSDRHRRKRGTLASGNKGAGPLAVRSPFGNQSWFRRSRFPKRREHDP